MWLQRPPTRAVLAARLAGSSSSRGYLGRNLAHWVARFVGDFAAEPLHLATRSRPRGLAHLLIMWGCILAAADHLPAGLRLGPLRDRAGRPRRRTATFVFGFPTFASGIDSLVGFLIFHGLVWSAFLVIAGVMLAMRRRMRDHGAAALQQFGEDFLPLILLFAISVTGLMLTASYTWMKGYAYDFLAILHAVTVIFTLLWLPFGKFFHIFQRPAQLGVELLQGRRRRRTSRRAAAAAASRSPRDCTSRT